MPKATIKFAPAQARCLVESTPRPQQPFDDVAVLTLQALPDGSQFVVREHPASSADGARRFKVGNAGPHEFSFLCPSETRSQDTDRQRCRRLAAPSVCN